MSKIIRSIPAEERDRFNGIARSYGCESFEQLQTSGKVSLATIRKILYQETGIESADWISRGYLRSGIPKSDLNRVRELYTSHA